MTQRERESEREKEKEREKEGRGKGKETKKRKVGRETSRIGEYRGESIEQGLKKKNNKYHMKEGGREKTI